MAFASNGLRDAFDGQGEAGFVAGNGMASPARLATLEDELALLSARFDDLQAATDHDPALRQDRLLRAFPALLDQRCSRR